MLLPKVKFLFFSILQDLTKTNRIEIDTDGNVNAALDKIFEIYGDIFKNRIIDQNSGNIKQYIIVAVNRKDIRHLNGLETELNDNDEISILPAAAGG
jgi:molybdopterin synthase sulfur carrier subunit